MHQVWVRKYGILIKRYKGVQTKKFYIVDMRDIHDPRVLAKHFDSVKQARRCIEKHLDDNHKRFEVVIGNELLDNPIKWIKRGLNKNKSHITKYEYPPERTTWEERHYYRVMEGKKRKKKLLTKKKKK